MNLALRLALLCILGMATALPAQAADKKVCVYDPVGRAGPIFGFMEPWAKQAEAWGASVELKPYPDEATAIKDFDAGSCDAVAASGVRLQRFNKSSYTLEALGGIPDYKLLGRSLVAVQKKDAYAWMFKSGSYEVAGVYPLGAVYAFVRDRSITSPSDLGGKKIATLDYDATSKYVVNAIGGIMVGVDLSTLGNTFNNGGADVTFLPATAYTPFELWNGLGAGGAVVKYPITQVTLQIMLKPADWPAGFAAKSRAFAADNFTVALGAVQKAEAEIPSKYWLTPSAEDAKAFDKLLRQYRKDLMDKGSYNAKVLALLKKGRCGSDATRKECAQEGNY